MFILYHFRCHTVNQKLNGKMEQADITHMDTKQSHHQYHSNGLLPTSWQHPVKHGRHRHYIRPLFLHLQKWMIASLPSQEARNGQVSKLNVVSRNYRKCRRMCTETPNRQTSGESVELLLDGEAGIGGIVTTA
jgi:hypothetical protein